MSLLSDYEARTAWKYAPISGRFPAHPALKNKVDGDGRFCPFKGSTVTFRLEERDGKNMGEMSAILRNRVGDMLAEPLPQDSYHMTLHDLVCPENARTERVYADEARARYTLEYDGEVRRSLESAGRIVGQIRREYAGGRVEMLADRVVNMVSKSVVLMLKPASEPDCRLLMDLYQRFNAVISLSYPLTPHVTLAYFRPGEIDGDRLAAVVEEIQPTGRHPIELSIQNLTAQMFWDMGHYQDMPDDR